MFAIFVLRASEIVVPSAIAETSVICERTPLYSKEVVSLSLLLPFQKSLHVLRVKSVNISL